MAEDNSLTQRRLKEVVEYNSDTGVFTRLSSASQIKAGSIAGGQDGKGYTRFSIDGKSYLAHRLAWLYVNGVFPIDQIDHLNHDRLDNRIANLRCVTHKENGKNQSLYKNNSSGVTGVNWDKSRGKWYSCIMVDGKTKSLGRHIELSDAVMARVSAEKELGFHSNHGVSV